MRAKTSAHAWQAQLCAAGKLGHNPLCTCPFARNKLSKQTYERQGARPYGWPGKVVGGVKHESGCEHYILNQARLAIKKKLKDAAKLAAASHSIVH